MQLGAVARPPRRARPAHPGPVPAATRPRLTIGTVAVAAALAGWLWAAVLLAGVGGREQPLGWTPGRDGGAWVVRRVHADGPAAGRLRPGDVLLAVDGDPLVRRLGPQWVLRDAPGRAAYRLTVRRGGATVEVRVPWPTVVRPGVAALRWAYLGVGGVYLVGTLLITLGHPGAALARRNLLAGVSGGLIFVSLALDPNAVGLSGPALWFGLLGFVIRPWQFVAGYRFNANFPVERQSTGAWRWFDRAVLAAAVVAWVPSALVGGIRALGPERALGAFAAAGPLPAFHDAVAFPLVLALAVGLSVANALVCWRNYHALTDPTLRRRLRWMSVGVGAGLLPVVAAVPLLAPRILLGRVVDAPALFHAANLATVVIPLSVAYAVLKQQVPGIRVVVRAGVRYLLARRVLQTASVLPLGLLAARVITHRTDTIADLVLGPGGRLTLASAALAGAGLAFRKRLLLAIDRRFFREAYRRDQIFVTLADAIARAADAHEVARLLGSEIDAALHPVTLVVVACEARGEYAVLHAAGGAAGPPLLAAIDAVVADLDRLPPAAGADALTALPAPAQAALEGAGVALAVPIRSAAPGTVGLLLLGPKRSEEPYTQGDRRMLETVAAQTGGAWETLRLRDQLRREQGARREVAARLGEAGALLLTCDACGTCYDGDAVTCAVDGRPLTPELVAPLVLGDRYRLRRLLGRGGMGSVFEADDAQTGTPVAVKLTVGRHLDDPTLLRRFAREARAAARLEHPHVVRALGYGELPGGAFLVLERLVGRTLRRELQQRGHLPPAECLPLFAAVCGGVEAAHAAGVIHRDIKPENIFLTAAPDGTPAGPKLLDFGLAVVRDLGAADPERLTRTGVALGTVQYMSLEQCLGDPVDERADVYALAVVVIETLTGPLGGAGPVFTRLPALIAERLAGPACGPAHHALANVLWRAGAEAPTARTRSVAEFRDALLPVLAAAPPLPIGAGGAEAVTRSLGPDARTTAPPVQ